MGKEDQTEILSKDHVSGMKLNLPDARLVVLTGALSGHEYMLRKEKIIIGRSDEANITIDYPGVSRLHAEIFFKEGSFHVKDLASTNGIYVNGTKTEEAKLGHNDQLKIGEIAFQYIIL
ncbi:MAG: FHA domain-containing protein [Pseudomonadota bacterium]